MKKHLLTLTLCTALVACATVSNTYAPDGKKAYTLNCSGLSRGWDKCQKAAGDICGEAGYKVLDKSSEDSASVGASNGSLFASKSNERSMMIECK